MKKFKINSLSADSCFLCVGGLNLFLFSVLTWHKGQRNFLWSLIRALISIFTFLCPIRAPITFQGPNFNIIPLVTLRIRILTYKWRAHRWSMAWFNYIHFIVFNSEYFKRNGSKLAIEHVNTFWLKCFRI